MNGLKQFRRVAIWVIVVSLSIAAVLGIYVILSGSSGELESDVMGTTGATGFFGVLVLAYLATLERPFRWVGLVGIPIAAITYAFALAWIWLNPEPGPWFWEVLGSGVLLSVAIAHASLIVRLILRPQPLVRWVVGVTLATIAAYAILGILPIVVPEFEGGDAYWRALWIVAILCVLGTVVSPVLGAVLRTRESERTRVTIDLPADLLARIDAAGPRDLIVRSALEREFPAAPRTEATSPA